MYIIPTSKRGFTLLELLTVIAIIGLLSAIVFSLLSEARAKGRDAQRLQTIAELRKAVDLYYAEYGYYPPLLNPATDARSRNVGATCSDGTIGDTNWCGFIAAIAPYHKGGIDDPTSSGIYTYYYDADGAQPAYYGLMVMLESPSNTAVADNDAGQYCSTCTGSKAYRGYEVGNEPKYCVQVNPASNWRTGATGVQCGP
jgi:prepilin-type N-terminal cleavage/methylation domain-containing protein